MQSLPQKIIIWSFLSYLWMLGTAHQCSKKSQQNTSVAQDNSYQSMLFQTEWVHAREQDQNGMEVYVKEGSKLPPARFRERMKFDEDGTFHWLMLAPNDAHKMNKGSWEKIDNNKVRVRIDDKQWTIEFKEISPERIVIIRQ
ncbi:hypothetical protein FHS56_001676 [Thermonema lapsum]|uniref:Uncharacterized protein n=1 Tax=Thermonema lapsum TaxID=28195 RepID=A0A846MRH9_9BACT|nr:hypothetical protein [Thermonema lapsum]NIK74163.1 hypothetical protein [Thermonema lapsum]